MHIYLFYVFTISIHILCSAWVINHKLVSSCDDNKWAKQCIHCIPEHKFPRQSACQYWKPTEHTGAVQADLLWYFLHSFLHKWTMSRHKQNPAYITVEIVHLKDVVYIDVREFAAWYLLQKSSSCFPLGRRNFLHPIWGLYPDDLKKGTKT